MSAQHSKPLNLVQAAPLFRAASGRDFKPTVDAIAGILEAHADWEGVIALDEFHGCITKAKPLVYGDGETGEWRDRDDIFTKRWLTGHTGVEPKTTAIVEAVDLVASFNRLHPVRDYLRDLRWDGRPRLRHWLAAYLGAKPTGTDDPDDPYLGIVGEKWLISAVARVFKPGCKADYVLILEGAQRTGKSTALRVLGGEWFLDTPIRIGDKDAYQAIRGKWIVELAELDSFSRAESSAAKAFFSGSEDHYRASYGRRSATVPRQCIFAGSVNHTQYLHDATGNTRYWPVACSEILIYPHQADDGQDCLTVMRDQLWAEAYQRYKDGAKWWPESPEDWDIIKREQAMREVGDAYQEILHAWLVGRGAVTMSEILGQGLNLETHKWTRAEQTRVGGVMQRLGWRKVRTRDGYEYRED